MAVRRIRNWWYVDLWHEGKRYRKKGPENSRAGAQAYELVLRNRLARGEGLVSKAELSEKSPPSFAEFAKEWFETYVKTNNKPSEQHQKACILRVHLLPFFGSQKLIDITNQHIEQYKSKKIDHGYSAKSINNHLAIFRKCMVCAMEWGHLPIVPLIRRLKALPPRLDYLDQVDSTRLLSDRTEKVWHEMALIALHSGMRLGELLGLDWTDIDIDHRVLVVRRSCVRGIITSTKSHRIRYVPMSDEVARVLTERRRRHGLVFGREDGRPFGYTMADQGLKQLCQRTKVRSIGWHTLRHTFATQLAERGVPLRIVQDLLGHSTITMTERYAHVAPSSLRAAVQVLERPSTEYLGTRWATVQDQLLHDVVSQTKMDSNVRVNCEK